MIRGSAVRPAIRSAIRSPIARVEGGGLPDLIANGDDGVAYDFTIGRMVVNDGTTPANTYRGAIGGKAVVTGSLATGADGSYFDASNYARLSSTAWPYDSTEITIAGEIMFDDATDATARTVFQIDPGGNDRLNLLALANGNALTLSMGLGGSALNFQAANSIQADTWFEFIVTAGPLGGMFFINGAKVATTASVLAANAAPTAFNGIGTEAALTGGATSTQPAKARMRNLVILPRAISEEVALAGLPFDLSVAAIGDSVTHGIVTGVVDDQALAYPNLLKVSVSRIGAAINAGDQGATTSEMYGHRADIAADGTPDLAIIYGGSNDVGRATTVEASPSPTDTVFTVASNIAYYAAGAKIAVGGEAATILSITGSEITLTAPLAGGAPAAATAVTIDTQGNLELLATYAQSIGCERVMIAGMHYFNWTSSGDTTSLERASNATLRGFQEAAATATGAVYVDLYEFMRQLIVDGTYTQGDWAAWHSSLNNQHLNANGQSILSDAFEATMRAEGWI